METHGRAARRPARRGADVGAIERDREAFVAAPGCADAEQFERIEESIHRLLRHRLEHHAEQARGAGEVALPQRVAGMARHRRMQQAQALRAAAPASARPQGRIRSAARAAPPSVRKPRWPRYTSSGPTCRPLRRTKLRRSATVALLAATVPSITSEWPPKYLVPAWIDRSTPKSSARK